MPMSCLDTDLGTILASSDFGEASGTVTWRGLPIAVGVFDDEDVEVELGEGVREIVHQAKFPGRSADFPGISDGDQMVIRARTFTVKHWSDDGTGMIEIFLEAQRQ